MRIQYGQLLRVLKGERHNNIVCVTLTGTIAQVISV